MYCNPRKGHHNTSHSTTRIDSYQKRISPLYSIINDLCYSLNISPTSSLTIFNLVLLLLVKTLQFAKRRKKIHTIHGRNITNWYLQTVLLEMQSLPIKLKKYLLFFRCYSYGRIDIWVCTLPDMKLTKIHQHVSHKASKTTTATPCIRNKIITATLCLRYLRHRLCNSKPSTPWRLQPIRIYERACGSNQPGSFGSNN